MEEFGVGGILGKLLHQGFHGGGGVEGDQAAAQQGNLLVYLGRQNFLFLARARLADVDGREDAAVGRLIKKAEAVPRVGALRAWPELAAQRFRV